MGKIEIDHTGAGAGITLSSDGTALLLDGTAIGGGGGGTALELYAENPSSPTAPSATGSNAVAIGNAVVASGQDSFSLGASTTASAIGAFALGRGSTASGNDSFAFGSNALASNTNALAIGTNTDATQNSSIAIGNGAQATSAYSFAVGRNSGGGSAVATTGLAATALGGSYASGTDSFAAAIANNTSSYGATGSNSVAIGLRAKASIAYGTAIGGQDNTAGSYSVVIGGVGNTASGAASFATGQYTVAAQRCKVAFGASQSGVLQQGGILVLRNFTSDATPKQLYAGGSTVGSEQVILPNNSAYAFHGTIVARQQASTGTACAAWKVEGLIRREGSAGTTVLVNSATTILDNTPAWGMTLSADTTNGGLAITVTGAAATNIRFVATINTSEVTY